MLRRLAPLALLGALAACDPPPPARPAAQPTPPAAPAAAPSPQRVLELTEQCGKASRDRFARDAIDSSATGQVNAAFTSHYNVKMNTCFYLLTVTRAPDGPGGPASGPSSGTLSMRVYDIEYGELYGEYAGPAVVESPPAGPPLKCRVESMYCASRGEWEVLVASYMAE